MQRVYETPSHATSEALGFFAYGALAAMTRLAKDGDQAPTIDAHIAHMEMADRAFQFFTQMGVWARHRGLDLAELADEYSGMFDDIDMRTRPSQWWERSVKTYITLGILSDLMREVAVCHKLFDDVSESWDLGQGAWVEEHLAPLTAQDGQLAARLSLWARRVAGEVLGLARATLFTHPNLAKDGDTADAISAEVTRRHGERMERISLKP